MSPDEYIIEHSHEITTRIDEYLKCLRVITEGTGMDLKLQESWVSSRLMSYNKR